MSRADVDRPESLRWRVELWHRDELRASWPDCTAVMAQDFIDPTDEGHNYKVRDAKTGAELVEMNLYADYAVSVQRDHVRVEGAVETEGIDGYYGFYLKLFPCEVSQ